MEDNKNNQQRVCPKDCRRCNMAQQIFCSTSLTFNLYDVMSKVWDRMSSIESKIDAIKNAESEFLTPLMDENDEVGVVVHNDGKTLPEAK